jgi:hypothetical protein
MSSEEARPLPSGLLSVLSKTAIFHPELLRQLHFVDNK